MDSLGSMLGGVLLQLSSFGVLVILGGLLGLFLQCNSLGGVMGSLLGVLLGQLFVLSMLFGMLDCLLGSLLCLLDVLLSLLVQLLRQLLVACLRSRSGLLQQFVGLVSMLRCLL